MTLKEIRCLLVPDDAELKNFEIVGNLDVRFIWNEKSQRNDILLLSDIRFVLKKYNCEILVKAGFICDGGSVPERFWDEISSPYATRYLLAFILHDAIYAAEIFTRDICDDIFLELMVELNCGWGGRNLAYMAVSQFGDSTWEDHTPKSIAEAKQSVEYIPFKISNPA
jgi:hypothetical protein